MKPQTGKLVFIVDDDPEDRQIILDAFLKSNTEFEYTFIDNADELLSRLNNPEKRISRSPAAGPEYPGPHGHAGTQGNQGKQKFRPNSYCCSNHFHFS